MADDDVRRLGDAPGTASTETADGVWNRLGGDGIGGRGDVER
ncbi:MAG: hypothetical protein ABR564_08065 [Candidatus Dormibacteria bacterium]